MNTETGGAVAIVQHEHGPIEFAIACRVDHHGVPIEARAIFIVREQTSSRCHRLSAIDYDTVLARSKADGASDLSLQASGSGTITFRFGKRTAIEVARLDYHKEVA